MPSPGTWGNSSSYCENCLSPSQRYYLGEERSSSWAQKQFGSVYLHQRLCCSARLRDSDGNKEPKYPNDYKKPTSAWSEPQQI